MHAAALRTVVVVLFLPELVVDGEVVDLNRIRLPVDGRVIDKRLPPPAATTRPAEDR